MAAHFLLKYFTKCHQADEDQYRIEAAGEMPSLSIFQAVDSRGLMLATSHPQRYVT